MALSSIALVTMVEARAALGMPSDASDDVNVEQVVNAASALAETVYCSRPLKARAYTNVRIAGPCHEKLYPLIADCDQQLAAPIDTAATVTIILGGTAQTLWKSEADGDPDAKDVAVFRDYFYRSGGWSTTSGFPSGVPRNVLLSYTGGLNPVPDDLKEATLELVQKLYPLLIQGRMDMASFSTAGGSVQTVEGAVGGAGVELWSLTPRARDVFKSYRLYRVG
jgi:hypothetical protein